LGLPTPALVLISDGIREFTHPTRPIGAIPEPDETIYFALHVCRYIPIEQKIRLNLGTVRMGLTRFWFKCPYTFRKVWDFVITSAQRS
jgi:hypothetical protein